MIELLPKLRATTKTTEKKAILAANNTWFIRSMFMAALNPFITYGINNIEIKSIGVKQFGVKDIYSFSDLLVRLKKRELTGNTARTAVNEFFSVFDAGSQELLGCVLQKDFKCGVSLKTVNSVFKIDSGLPFIPEFAVQLADKAERFEEISNYPVICEPKYDGMRCLAIHDGALTLFSRQGKELDFPVIKEELLRIMQPGDVLDGELFHEGGFQKLMTQAKRINNRDMDNLNSVIYYVFDCLTSASFKDGICKLPLKDRKENLLGILNVSSDTPHIKQSPHEVVASVDEAKNLYFKYVAEGFEGIMVKNPNAYYECKRSKNWLKVKPVNEMDCEIVNLAEGEGKNIGKLGAIVVKQENGAICSVGSGFTDAQRDELWANKEALKGQIVEVQYQELSTGEQVMRFPVFYRLRPDKN